MKPLKEKTELKVNWSKREGDLMFHYPDKKDGMLVHWAFTKNLSENTLSLLVELEHRGYDLRTLKFSIKKKETL